MTTSWIKGIDPEIVANKLEESRNRNSPGGLTVRASDKPNAVSFSGAEFFIANPCLVECWM